MASLIKFEKNAAEMGGSYCTITIRNLVKRTQVTPAEGGILKWDQVKHFPIQIVRNRRHPYNLIKVELFGYAPNSTSDIVMIGAVSFHLHDILRANPIAGTYDLWNDNIQVGDIDLEFTHSYGSFGYGVSPQLKEDDMKPDEIINYSLFPRIIPSDRRKRELDNPVMVACAVPHPPFIDFKEKQEEITVSLQDDTNLEGDTQHRVLISKEYTKFVTTSVLPEHLDESPNSSNPILVSPPAFPLEPAPAFLGGMLKATSDARKKNLAGTTSIEEVKLNIPVLGENLSVAGGGVRRKSLSVDINAGK
ncbi:hypothetical protein HDU98_007355 [Podochytrium sp. JEL0797]|nr:hypothetical protein HDU98_007355 [Podochytrium sp. JEL0797]